MPCTGFEKSTKLSRFSRSISGGRCVSGELLGVWRDDQSARIACRTVGMGTAGRRSATDDAWPARPTLRTASRSPATYKRTAFHLCDDAGAPSGGNSCCKSCRTSDTCNSAAARRPGVSATSESAATTTTTKRTSLATGHFRFRLCRQ